MALRAEQWNVEPHELTLARRIFRRRAFHGREHSSGLHEMAACGDEIAQGGKGARNDHIEQRPWLPSLDAAFVNFHVRERKFDRGLTKKRGFLLARFRQCDVPAGPGNGDRNPGSPAPEPASATRA